MYNIRTEHTDGTVIERTTRSTAQFLADRYLAAGYYLVMELFGIYHLAHNNGTMIQISVAK